MWAFIVLLGVGSAHAGDDGPLMWGVGPTVSTIAAPARFPTSFPKEVKEDTDLAQVRGDIAFGAEGVLYLRKKKRVAGHATLGTGNDGYRSVQLSIEYDQFLLEDNRVGAFYGAGLGVGRMTFGDDDTNAELKMGTYNLRGDLGGIYRDKTRAYELGLFAELIIPGIQTYTKADGTEEEVGGFLSSGFYPYLGVEATVYFGDFKAPNKNKKSKKDKKSNKKKKKNNTKSL